MRRLVISYLVIAVLPLSIIVVVYIINTINEVRETEKQRLESAAELVGSQFEALMTNMSFLSINLLSNEDFTTAIQQLEQEENAQLQQEYYAQISSEIRTYAIFSSLYDVTFFNDQGYLVTSYGYNKEYNYKYRMSREAMNEISWYSKVQNNFGQEIIMPLQEKEIPKSDRKSMSLVRAIRNPGKVIGYLCVEIGADKLDYLLEVDTALETELLIVRKDGVVLYGSEDFPVHLKAGVWDESCVADLQRDYFISEREAGQDAVIYMAMAKSAAYAQARNSIAVLCLVTFIMLCLTVLVITAFSRDLSKPLMKLREEMKETTLNNLQSCGERQLFERYEEISYVYHQFHEMRERLDIMIQREMENQKMYLEERMNYLQAQINPHFMCNTLNIIGIMGMEHGAWDVHEACLQLSSLLRYSIVNKENSVSTLREEMDNIQDYLKLMQLRYEHKLESYVFYEESMGGIPIPRLVLEPFVENIFVHAYSAVHKCVRVNVTGYIRKKRWYVVIEDNGQGMKREKLFMLKEQIDTCCRQLMEGNRTSQKHGIGIENTIMRLYLYYNPGFQYELESGGDGGFRIIFSADWGEESEYGTDNSSDSRG